ncbi:MAG: DNA gyrase subunit A, partial [Carnobacterium sp.]
AVELMAYLKGPDFPTGGILQGIDGIRKAYETGKGKVIVRSKTHIEELRGGKQQIVINEIPYDVNKAMLVRKMDEIRLNKKIDGIAEVRDESDRTGLQIVVELKKDVNAQGILTYLLKSTDLQVSYNFNMVAIDKKRPQQVGIVRMLEAYLEHQNEVIVRRTQFNLRKAETRAHIVVGLIKALSILDEVIATIRGSKDKKNAKDNIIEQFGFTEEQAEAIVSLQLYRLTNTDITALESEASALEKAIASFNKILTSPAEMKRVMKKELSEIKTKYGSPRRTVIENEIEELKVETEVLVTQEEVMVSVTKEGYIKRTSLRSYGASKPEEIGVREGDHPIFVEQLNTLNHLLLFTTKGNIIYRPVHEIAEFRWKDSGEHLSQNIALGQDETILKVFGLKTLETDATFTIITKEGFIKQSTVDSLTLGRSYLTKSFIVMKLKTETDKVENVVYTENSQNKDVFLITRRGFGLRYALNEVPIVGAKASGVKSINLKKDDYVINGIVFDATASKTEVLILTQRGSVKKMNLNDFDTLGRAKRGLLVLRELKSNPHRVAFLLDGSKGLEYTIVTEKEKVVQLTSSSYQISDRYSNGSFILDEGTDGSPVDVKETIFSE